jgi:hypothetical protein|tara:strand:- start:2288 stop:2596 length:309 start_codon:yes stop_codon:yes gene_type:complete
MRYCFDIDGTICSTNCEYKDAVPYLEVIEWINKKYDEGHHIQFFSSRGTKSKIDWFKFTLDQLDDWGVKYHSVKLGKPDYDLFIDDKGINNEEWYKIEGLSK